MLHNVKLLKVNPDTNEVLGTINQVYEGRLSEVVSHTVRAFKELSVIITSIGIYGLKKRGYTQFPDGQGSIIKIEITEVK